MKKKKERFNVVGRVNGYKYVSRKFSFTKCDGNLRIQERAQDIYRLVCTLFENHPLYEHFCIELYTPPSIICIATSISSRYKKIQVQIHYNTCIDM